MDQPHADPVLLDRSLQFLQWINRLMYARQVVGHLRRFSRGWTKSRPVRILDIATGSADIPRRIIAWGKHRGFEVQVVGIDLHPRTAELARRQGPCEKLVILRADARALPFAPGSFDYAICSLFLHHLDDDQVVHVLREMDRVATRGIIVADLLRNYRAWLWIRLLTLPLNPMVRHDGPASVAQGFTPGEVQSFCRQAGVEYVHYYRHFGHRFVLAGERIGR